METDESEKRSARVKQSDFLALQRASGIGEMHSRWTTICDEYGEQGCDSCYGFFLDDWAC